MTLMHHCYVRVWGVAILVFHICFWNYHNQRLQYYPILASKGLQVKLSNTVEPYSHHSTKSIPGLLCLQMGAKYFVGCVA